MKIENICAFCYILDYLLSGFIVHFSFIGKNASCLSRYGDQIVAIKVLNGGKTSEERASLGSRFVREVVMMSRVKHENLVKVITPYHFSFSSNFIRLRNNTILIIFSKCCF